MIVILAKAVPREALIYSRETRFGPQGRKASRRSAIAIPMAKPGNAAGVPLWAKPRWGERGPNVQWTFAAVRTPGKDAGLGSPSRDGFIHCPVALFDLRCSSLIGNEPITLLAPCPARAKVSGASARIMQSFPSIHAVTARWPDALPPA